MCTREKPLVRWLQRLYERVLARIISRPRPVFVATAVVMVVGFGVLPFLGESLFPHFKERDFLIHWITKPGTSVAEERRIVTRLSKELRAIPGVRNFGSHIGQALLADELNGVNFGENWISVDPAADYDETVAAIEEVVYGYPGLFHNVETYLNERIDEVLSGSSQTFVVRIYGPDLKDIHDKAEEVEEALQGIPGIVDSERAAPIRGAPDPGRSESRRGAALWPQTRRCAPGVRHAAGRRRSRRPLPGRQGVRRERVEHARHAAQL